MIIVRFILKLIFSITALFGIFGFSRYLFTKKFFIPGNGTDFLIFFAGILVFTGIWMFFLRKRGNIWSTLEHELTHALFATLFLKKIHTISASRRKGGLISIEGGNSLIALSPYFFPLAPILALLIGLILPDHLQNYVNFVMGISVQFHLLNLMKEMHLDQPDLQMSGYLFSIIIILFFNLFFMGLILAFVADGFNGIHQFIWDGLKSSVYLLFDFGEYFFQQLRTTINNF
jgi:hypothetical protein